MYGSGLDWTGIEVEDVNLEVGMGRGFYPSWIDQTSGMLSPVCEMLLAVLIRQTNHRACIIVSE